MKNDYLEFVGSRVALYDGGMGTMLFQEGLVDGESPEPWNWERPEVVNNVYRAYYQAGADVVQTNTFGGTTIKLSERDLQDRTYDANYLAAKALSGLCPEGRFAAGDVGPTGKFLKPMGEFDLEEFDAAFEAQMHGLVDGGVDLISIETMYSLDETVSALRAAKKVSGLPVSVCMTFNQNPRGFFTLMGETVPHCIKMLEENGADIVGSNCTHGTPVFKELIVLLRDCTDLPIIVQPNRGNPVLERGEMSYKQTVQEYVEDIRDIADLGVSIIGGCCGTTPEFTSGMREVLGVRPVAGAGGEAR